MQQNIAITPLQAEYTLRQFAYRMGLASMYTPSAGFDALGVKVHYGKPAKELKEGGPVVIIVPCRQEAWDALLVCRNRSLHWTEAKRIMPNGFRPPLSESVPVLLWGAGYEDGGKPFVERREDGRVIFYADILASAFFMLSRWEEQVISARDAHGRFPASASVAYKQEFLDRPVVDEYAMILKAWLQTLVPGWTPEPNKFKVHLSHDIDHIYKITSLYGVGRALARNLLRNRSLRQVVRTLEAGLKSESDPFYRAIYELSELSERFGFRSSFYFMGARPGNYDTGYNPASPHVRRCIDNLRKRGHEVGFHAGYDTLDNPDRFFWEKARLDQVLGKVDYGGRQHFLRFRIPDSWRLWEHAGMYYDSTLGYAEHEGFRCGTCYPFHPFDIEQNRQLDLLEIPLIVMDHTLRGYRGLTPEQGGKSILTLAERCREVGGIFTLLWHNSSLDGEHDAWVGIYRGVLPVLAEMEGRTPFECSNVERSSGDLTQAFSNRQLTGRSFCKRPA